MRRNLWLRIGLVVAVIAVCAWLLYPPEEDHQSRPRPPGRPPPRARRGRGQGHRVAGLADGRHHQGGAPEEGHRRLEGRAARRERARGPARLAAAVEGRPDRVGRHGHLRRQGVRSGDRARRPRPQVRRGPPAPRAGRAPGARDHPEPDRPVRRRRADDPAAGRQPDPHPAPRRRRSRARQGPHRQDGAARVQARRRQGRPEAAATGAVPLPADDELLYQRRVDKETKQERKIPYVVQKKVLPDRRRPHHRAASPSTRTPASPTCRSSSMRPAPRRFGDLTEANVGRRLAIVLDGNVHSAPSIRERIPSGRAADHRRVHERGGHGPRHRPAGGRAAGAGAVPRGADGGTVARRRLDPQGPHLDGRPPPSRSSSSCWSTTGCPA